ncbi:MAG: DCC1-like thiol-disulfide oxidoreductase family protein [Pyrinomonadaceae bacterium]
MTENKASELVMLYDGVCGLCNRSVQTILRADKRGTLRFAPLQSDYGKAAIARHTDLREVDSVVLLEKLSNENDERVFVRSDAALRIASYLGGIWKLLVVFRVLPAPIRDFFYDTIARYRYKFFGKHDACLLPAPEVRARFLDTA